MKVLRDCAFLVALFSAVNGFSAGPPPITSTIPVTLRLRNGSGLTVQRGEASCVLMHPGHINVASSNDPNDPADNGGYVLQHNVSLRRYQPDTEYSVEVLGTVNGFRGFMVQARDANGNLIGSFRDAGGNAFAVQTLNCDPIGVNTEAVAVHNNPSGISTANRISLIWTSPGDTGSVFFTYTVVRIFSSIYVRLRAATDGVLPTEVPTTEAQGGLLLTYPSRELRGTNVSCAPDDQRQAARESINNEVRTLIVDTVLPQIRTTVPEGYSGGYSD